MNKCRYKELTPQCVSINHPIKNEGAKRILKMKTWIYLKTLGINLQSMKALTHL